MPHAEYTQFTVGEVLCEPYEAISHAYFVNNGLVSLMSVTEEGQSIEVAMINHEGLVGMGGLLGADNVPYRAVVQADGSAVRVKLDVARELFMRRKEFQRMVLRYMHSMMTQISQSAVCNRFHTVEQRLARWLLMSQDRLRTDRFAYTQELMSQMLGTDRPSVTLAAGALKRAGIINYRRGQVTILDRDQLLEVTCECYRIVKTSFDQSLST